LAGGGVVDAHVDLLEIQGSSLRELAINVLSSKATHEFDSVLLDKVANAKTADANAISTGGPNHVLDIANLGDGRGPLSFCHNLVDAGEDFLVLDFSRPARNCRERAFSFLTLENLHHFLAGHQFRLAAYLHRTKQGQFFKSFRNHFLKETAILLKRLDDSFFDGFLQ
jgi:hypothetical protein